MNNNERNSFIAIAICIVFYLGFTQYLNRKYPEYSAGKSAPTPAETAAVDPSAAASATPVVAESPATPTTPSVAKISEDSLIIDTPMSVYRLSQDRGSIDSIRLKNYRRTSDQASESIELLDSPLFLRATIRGEKNHLTISGFAAERSGDAIKMWRDVPGWRLEQEFRPSAKDFTAEITTTFTNTSTSASRWNCSRLT